MSWGVVQLICKGCKVSPVGCPADDTSLHRLKLYTTPLHAPKSWRLSGELLHKAFLNAFPSSGLIFVVPKYMPSLISILKQRCIPCRHAKPTSLMHIGVEDPTAPGPNGGDLRLARACRMHFGRISRLWLKFRVFRIWVSLSGV